MCIPARAADRLAFEDVAATAGVSFRLENDATPEKQLIETMTDGVAAFDYNGDGLPDLYFANGAEQPSLSKVGPDYANRLYRNDGGLRFTDLTDRARLGGHRYSMAAAADVDNDGHVDLFVAGVRRAHLYRNTGNGSFEEVSQAAGVANEGMWSVGAAWLDYDLDGWLDLFVVTYPSRLDALTVDRGGWGYGIFDLDNDGLVNRTGHPRGLHRDRGRPTGERQFR